MNCEAMPDAVREQVPDYSAVREIYLKPRVAEIHEIRFGDPDEAGVIRFLCDERRFSEARVRAALDRMRKGRHASAPPGSGQARSERR